MRQKNNGKGTANALQNQFTRFLVTSIGRDKAKYLKRKDRITGSEIPSETDTIDATARPARELLDLVALTQALDTISEKERFVFFARVLDGRDYHEIGKELGLGYKGACAIYYRTCRKLKEMLWR